MVLQFVGDLHELLEALRQILFQFGNRLGCTDSGYHIFPLCVDQVLAVDTLCAGGRIPGKSNAGTGGIAHITKYHSLHIDCCSPIARNVVHTAVYDRSLVIPGTEHGLDSLHQLHLRLLREIFPFILLINIFKSNNYLLQILCRQFCIKLDSLSFLENSFKIRFRNFHNDIRKHLDESSIGVISKSGIACLLRKALYCYIRQTKIQDRIHHARHRSPRTGTHRYKKRILGITEFLTLSLFQNRKCIENLSFDFIRDLPAAVIIVGTGLCRNCKSLGDRQSQIRHLSKVRTFSTKEITHIGIAFFK